METIKLITGVTIEEVPYFGQDSIEIRMVDQTSLSRVDITGDFILTPLKTNRRIIPVKYWYKNLLVGKGKGNYTDPNTGKEYSVEEGAIAISPEIDETIGKYLNILDGEVSNLNTQLAGKQRELDQMTNKHEEANRKLTTANDVIQLMQDMPFFKRLRWAFTKKVF